MKKLALMTTAAALMLTAPAFAGHDKHAENYGDHETYKMEVQAPPSNTKVETITKTRTELRPSTRQEYTLVNGQKIIVQNNSVYLANKNGQWKYPAPQGSYKTTGGLTVVSDDGVWLRTEGPMETVYVDVVETDNTESN